MKIIYSSPNNLPILIDDEDHKWLSKFKWHLRDGYAVRNLYLGRENNKPKNTVISMHREILKHHGIYLDKETDHINHNKLDNRKINLRAVTTSQNQWNRKLGKNNTSGYKGVALEKRNNKWKARIKKKFLHYFDTPEKAAQTYNEAAQAYFGEYAKLN